MHNSELVYLKICPNPPAAWARFARLAPPEKPMVPAWPPQLGIPSYATDEKVRMLKWKRPCRKAKEKCDN